MMQNWKKSMRESRGIVMPLLETGCYEYWNGTGFRIRQAA